MNGTSAGAHAAATSPPPDRATARRRREDIARGLILVAAFASFVLSVSLWFAGDEQEGIFVGIWVPSIVSLGAFLLPRRGEST
jgi:hypothetical protein